MDSPILITEVVQIPRSTGSTYPESGVSWTILFSFFNLFCEWIKHSDSPNYYELLCCTNKFNTPKFYLQRLVWYPAFHLCAVVQKSCVSYRFSLIMSCLCISQTMDIQLRCLLPRINYKYIKYANRKWLKNSLFSGVAAILLGLDPKLTSAQISSELVRLSTPNRVKDAKTDSPNRLLYIGRGRWSRIRYSFISLRH